VQRAATAFGSRKQLCRAAGPLALISPRGRTRRTHNPQRGTRTYIKVAAHTFCAAPLGNGRQGTKKGVRTSRQFAPGATASSGTHRIHLYIPQMDTIIALMSSCCCCRYTHTQDSRREATPPPPPPSPPSPRPAPTFCFTCDSFWTTKIFCYKIELSCEVLGWLNALCPVMV